MQARRPGFLIELDCTGAGVGVAGPAVVRCRAYSDAMGVLTNSRVDRAGDRIRRIARGQETDS